MLNQWEKGQKAEQLAADYLREKGYGIWKSNWRSGKKEIDLAAIYKNELVIIEVKSMTGNLVNLPGAVVDRKKQRHIILAADAFIRVQNWKGPTRFDVIAVRFSPRGVDFEHIENAFIPAIEPHHGASGNRFFHPL